jgi:hypothetical protein
LSQGRSAGGAWRSTQLLGAASGRGLVVMAPNDVRLIAQCRG